MKEDLPQPAHFISPFTDYGFKLLFGEEPNKDLLLSFLNELLKNEQGELKDLFEKWMYVLKNLPRLQRIPEKLQEKIFQKLFKTASLSQLTSAERDKYEDSLKIYRDSKNVVDTAEEEEEEGEAKGRKEGKQEGVAIGLEQGLEQGLAKGLEQGQNKARNENALMMLKAGLPEEDISAYSGLSYAEIQELKKRLKK